DQPEQGHREEEGGGVNGPAEQRPRELSESDVGGAQRRCEHGVKAARVLELEEEVEGRVEHRPVHRRHREQSGRDERVVVDRLASDVHAADERADAHTDREQVQQWLREPGEEDHPLAPVRQHVALDDVDEEGAHCVSFFVNERVPQYHPAMTHATRTATCTTAGKKSMDPVIAPRHSSTPCHSGDSQQSRWSASGSCETGKNVPENRKSGMMPMRRTTGNRASVSCVAENAVSGAAKAVAQSAAAGMAKIPHGEITAPRIAATIRKIDAPTADRTVVQATTPA